MTEKRVRTWVRPILFSTAKCPQKWPTKTGRLWWNCREPVAFLYDYEDGTAAPLCAKHHEWYARP